MGYKKISGIYIIKNIITNHVYIGHSICLKSRLSRHKNALSGKYHENEYLQNSWNKYGSKNFEFDILDECCFSNLLHMENYWCNILKSHDRNYGYNIQPINVLDNKVLVSKETKSKMSKSQKGKKASEETKRKMAEIRKGKPIHTKESKEKIINSNKNRKISLETKEKMSLKRKEWRNKNPDHNPFKNMSKESKQKLFINKKRRIILEYDLYGNFVKRHLALNQTGNTKAFQIGVWRCCNNKLKSYNESVYKYEV